MSKFRGIDIFLSTRRGLEGVLTRELKRFQEFQIYKDSNKINERSSNIAGTSFAVHQKFLQEFVPEKIVSPKNVLNENDCIGSSRQESLLSPTALTGFSYGETDKRHENDFQDTQPDVKVNEDGHLMPEVTGNGEAYKPKIAFSIHSGGVLLTGVPIFIVDLLVANLKVAEGVWIRLLGPSVCDSYDCLNVLLKAIQWERFIDPIEALPDIPVRVASMRSRLHDNDELRQLIRRSLTEYSLFTCASRIKQHVNELNSDKTTQYESLLHNNGIRHSNDINIKTTALNHRIRIICSPDDNAIIDLRLSNYLQPRPYRYLNPSFIFALPTNNRHNNCYNEISPIKNKHICQSSGSVSNFISDACNGERTSLRVTETADSTDLSTYKTKEYSSAEHIGNYMDYNVLNELNKSFSCLLKALARFYSQKTSSWSLKSMNDCITISSHTPISENNSYEKIIQFVEDSCNQKQRQRSILLRMLDLYMFLKNNATPVDMYDNNNKTVKVNGTNTIKVGKAENNNDTMFAFKLNNGENVYNIKENVSEISKDSTKALNINTSNIYTKSQTEKSPDRIAAHIMASNIYRQKHIMFGRSDVSSDPRIKHALLSPFDIDEDDCSLAGAVVAIQLRKMLRKQKDIVIWDPFCCFGSVLAEISLALCDIPNCPLTLPSPMDIMPIMKNKSLNQPYNTFLSEYKTDILNRASRTTTLVGSDERAVALRVARHRLHMFGKYCKIGESLRIFMPEMKVSVTDTFQNREDLCYDDNINFTSSIEDPHYNYDYSRFGNSDLRAGNAVCGMEKDNRGNLTISLHHSKPEEIAPFIQNCVILTRIPTPKEAEAIPSVKKRAFDLYERFGHLIASRDDWSAVFVITRGTSFQHYSRLEWEVALNWKDVGNQHVRLLRWNGRKRSIKSRLSYAERVASFDDLDMALQSVK